MGILVWSHISDDEQELSPARCGLYTERAAADWHCDLV